MLQKKGSTRRPTYLFFGMVLLSLVSLSGKAEEHKLANPKGCPGSLIDSESTQTHDSEYRCIRVIDDPGTGHHWLLVQQVNRPETPGLLIQNPGNLSCASCSLKGSEHNSSSGIRMLPVPVIHSGDSIVLSEKTASLDARLEATALQTAAVGAPLEVRLKVGGRLVHAFATAPGRAAVLARRNWTQP
jgi:hypothetical protein